MANALGYPFVTRKQIVARLESEPAFVKECASILQARTEQRAAGGAPSGKAWGWMSSERVVAGRLTAKSKIGMLSEEEESRLAKLVARYSRQLADHFRALAVAEDPGLSEAAERFGVGRTAPDPSDISRGPRNPQESAERCHPSGERQPDVLEDDLDAVLDGDPEIVEDELDDDEATDDGAGPEPAQDDPLPRRAMEFVERMPGERTAAIADALGVTTALLAPTLRALVQGRKLRKQGFGRGTRYFAR
ncbi:MAG: hypothetical protein WDO69_08635 [Pseudomonadota bacterium]